jgi:hypothetical protein
MKVSRRQFVIDSAAIALTSTTPLYARRETLRILIVDDVNNHDWRSATARMREILLQTGRFQVDVSTTPLREALPAEWPSWKPEFSRYHAVINNFNGGETEKGTTVLRPQARWCGVPTASAALQVLRSRAQTA